MTLDALTSASVHSLWSSPKWLKQLCLTVFSSLRLSLLLLHIFLPNFFLLVNFAFNMLWYSTPWTATPFNNDLLRLTLFVEGVFWTIAKSAVFPIIVLSKNKRYPQFIILSIYHLLIVIYWNSNVNILIFWCEHKYWNSCLTGLSKWSVVSCCIHSLGIKSRDFCFQYPLLLYSESCIQWWHTQTRMKTRELTLRKK